MGRASTIAREANDDASPGRVDAGETEPVSNGQKCELARHEHADPSAEDSVDLQTERTLVVSFNIGHRS